MKKFFRNLRWKLRVKLSLLKECRKRNSLYPRVIPQNLSEIDLGEELTHLRSLTSSSINDPDLDLPTQATAAESQCTHHSDSIPESPVEGDTLDVTSLSTPEMNFQIDSCKHVQLVQVSHSSHSSISGRVKVSNLAYSKKVSIRWTSDNWVTFKDEIACHCHSSDNLCRDYFAFSLKSPSVEVGSPAHAAAGGVFVEFAVCYQVSGMEFWDNNEGQNFSLVVK